jgi:hypothetical protein
MAFTVNGGIMANHAFGDLMN